MKTYNLQKEEESKKICPECEERVIPNGHELVCNNCGIVVSEVKFEESYQINENRDSDFKSGDQFVSVGKTVDSVTTLGSNIGYFNSNVFYDYRKNILSSSKQRMFRKLKRYYFLPSKIKNHETDYRIFKILNKIVSHLGLSQQLKSRAAYFYRAIKKNAPEIKNHVSLIAFCIFYSSREYSHQAPINIRELCKVFRDYGHRITPRLIIRDNIEYNKFIKQKNTPHKCEDYIYKLVDRVVNWDKMKERMVKKGSKWSIEEYRIFLLKSSKFILSKLKRKQRGSRNPYIMAATTVYCADRVLSKKKKSKKILTQKIASKAMKIPEYSIRDHFVKVFKPYFNL